MRAGVIRGDMPGPILLADLEPVTDRNVPTEAPGQVRYLSRPTVAEVEAALADETTGAGAVIEGSTLAFNVTVTAATTDDLKLKTSAAAAFTTYTIAAAVYTNLTDLIAAINAALAGSGVTCRENIAGDGIALESDEKGVNSYLELDTEANGSNADTNLGLPDGDVRDMPSAAAFITDTLPVGGPLDVSTATIEAVGAGDNANALSLIPAARGTTAALAEAIAPQFTETPVLEDSMRSGMLYGFLNANYNPGPDQGLVDGPAIEVVQDDGSTAYTVGLPTIASATLDSPGAGDVTIAGTDLAGPGDPTAERKEVVVKFTGTGTPGGPNDALILSQELIEANGGTVTSTSIVVPAVLNTLGFATTTTSVVVKVRSYATAAEALA